MRQYEFYPPHLINVAILPCESQNIENVTLQRDINKENCIRCIGVIEVDQGHHVPKIYLPGWPKKFGTIILYALTLPNINRFSKLFLYQNQEKICNNTVTRDPTTPQVCRCTTL